jgi:hypothetical protein
MKAPLRSAHTKETDDAPQLQMHARAEPEIGVSCNGRPETSKPTSRSCRTSAPSSAARGARRLKGLAPAGRSARLAPENGAPAVTDGPFAEAANSRRLLIVEVICPERAYQIAAEASAARRGRAVEHAIEVRQVMSAPPVDV